MSFRPRSKLRQTIVIALVALLLFVQNTHPFFVPSARAFPVEVLADIQAAAKEFKDVALKGLTTAAMTALLQGVSFFAKKVAYDFATNIVEGNKGKGPLFHTQGIGEYLKGAALDSAGEAISAFGEPFGLDLCQIPNPRINVFLQIGLRSLFPDGTEPKPKCEWQQIRNQWGNIGNVLEERYGKGGSRLASQVFNANVSVSQSDFGVALNGISIIDENQVAAGIDAALQRLVGEGLKDVTNAISGHIQTPSELLKEDLKLLSTKEQQDLSAGQIAGIYGSQLEAVPAFAANVFLNTLASKLLNKLITGLFPQPRPNQGGDSFSFFGQGPGGFSEQARRALRGLLLTPTIQEVNDYKILDEYAACPSAPGLNNCVLDNGLRQAIDRAKQTPLTIKQALDEGLLHAEWPLVSPRRSEDNTNTSECYLNKYCYSNLQKLRKVRILPLGFELAALKSNPDNPWTLGQVVAGFNECANQNGQLVADARNPFCHLIDPNWVIKAPPVRCQSQLFGALLAAKNTPVRHDECMDLQTCIVQDANGTCQNWGYCTREKNTWILGGEACPSYYNTCTAYQNLTDNSQVSYLSRTVDFGECSAANAGCRAYSTAQANDQWLAPAPNRALYFNKQVQSCPASADGCTAFYNARRSPSGQFVQDASGAYARVANNIVPLKRAPDYLGCYDTNRATPAIDWPQTRAQALSVAANHPRCGEFAAACAPSEVGCELYTPTAGNAAPIPGVVATANVCDADCVGYETFREEAPPGKLDGARFPLYFIPPADPSAQCSSADEGCAEFTSLEAAAAGGEQTQYYSYVRACERPTGTNEKTFFSWEGSEREGYALRTHRLLQIDQTAFTYLSGLANNPAGPTRLTFTGRDTVQQVFPIGSPAYNDTTLANLQREYNNCNATTYGLLVNSPFAPGAASADCRALYDSAGNIYYRILSDTVTVSNQCARLRKTESRLYIDDAVTTENICRLISGLWGNADADAALECQRCFGGGRYQDGICVYQTIPAESRQCPSAAVGCRAYTGNAGNNVQPNLVNDSFETAATSTIDRRAASAFWFPAGAVSIAAESLQVGGHSLAVNGNTVFRHLATGTLQFGEWYEVEFWARGAAQNLEVHLAQDLNENGIIYLNENGTIESPNELTNRLTRDAATNREVTITVSGEWRRYRLGPAQFTGRSNLAGGLVFIRTAIGTAQPYYLDFVRIGKLESKLYLLKNSWQTPEGNDAPPVCDATPRDPFPGAALGCQAYTDSQKNQVFVTGFSSLCREAAIGCQPLYETHNTVGEARAKIYNLRCVGSGGQVCRIVVPVTVNNVTNNQEIGNCRVGAGQTACFIPEVTLPAGIDLTAVVNGTLQRGNSTAVVTSTVYIPAEANSTPIFLTNRANVQCRESEIGCRRLGLQNQTELAVEYTDIYLINNPAQYVQSGGGPDASVGAGILCREDTLACGEFRANGNPVYFKDPKLTGNSVCEYKTEVQVGANKASGWFRGDLPCYPTGQAGPNFYEIFSNRAATYRGFVGACPLEADKCAELVDPLDRSASGGGRSYYRIYDERLTERIGECNGQVSLKEGCVLFDRPDQPNKLYSAALTYAASDAANPRYALVAPRSESDRSRNNTNLILKVDRDRACSEWLACRNAVVIKNDEYPGGRRLCSQYKACDATEPGKECTNFPDSPLTDRFLDERVYTGRDVSWFGADYSGYSLLNRYQITDYAYVTFPGDDNQYLAYQADDRLFRSEGDRNDPLRTGFGNLGCRADPNEPRAEQRDRDGRPCGLDSAGRCYQSRCLYPVEGAGERQFAPPPPTLPANPTPVEIEANQQQNFAIIKRGISAPSCKGFPEEDSPFPEYLAADFLDQPDPGLIGWTDIRATPRYLRPPAGDLLSLRTPLDRGGGIPPATRIQARRVFSDVSSEYQKANLCQTGNCSCEYNKYEYENGKIDYFSPATTAQVGRSVPDGICTGGVQDGFPCTDNRDCTEPRGLRPDDPTITSSGTCSALKEKETHFGLKGFCLEPDLSRPINGLARPGTGRAQEYACLTWLPIQTSATRVDLLNRFQQAGYWPVADYDGPLSDPVTGRAPIGGELYCAAVDRGGLRDPAQVPEVRPATVLADNSGFITPPLTNGVWCITGDQQQRNYEREICGDTANNEQINRTRLIQLLQYYAWSRIANNAIVLRAEFRDAAGSNGFTGRLASASTPLAPVNLFLTNSGQTPNQSGYNSPAISQNLINEASLDRVHFIPLATAGTFRGMTPRLLYDGLVLEVRRLRELLNINQAGVESRLDMVAVPDAESIAIAYEGLNNLTERRAPINFPIRQTDRNGEFDAIYTAEQNNPFLTPFAVWNYALNRQGNDDPRFRIFNASNQIGPSNQQIQRKYVFVLFTPPGGRIRIDGNGGNTRTADPPSWLTAMDGNLRLPTNNDDNPFTAPCRQGESVRDSAHNTNWLAVSLDFDTDGRFIQYTSRWCFAHNENEAPDGGSIVMAVIGTLRNQCTQLVQVYDSSVRNPLSENTNKAWTNRVWQGAQNPGTGGVLRHPRAEYGRDANAITLAQPNRPFFSLPLSGSLLSNLTNTTNLGSLLGHEFIDPARSGVPYSCADNLYGEQALDPGTLVRACAFYANHPYQRGISFLPVLQRSGLQTGTDGLLDLFAWHIRSARLQVNRGGYTPLAGRQDVSGDRQTAEILRPGQTPEPLAVPRVFSLNPATCFTAGANPASGGASCTAGEPDNLTVNRRNQFTPLKDYNNDRIFDEDPDADGFPDPIIGRNSETVNLQFFAAADDNRMPIRQVTVLWGDGDIANDNVPGLYQNHKPVCADNESTVIGLCAMANPANPTGQSIPSTLTCRTAADCPRELISPTAQGECLLPGNTRLTGTYTVPRFGNTPRACSQTPLEFEHTYFCTQSMLADRINNPQVLTVNTLPPPLQLTLARGFRLAPTDPVCVYRPRVHVRDNWGYCNGICPGGPAGERCYNGSPTTVNECDYNDEQNAQSGRFPWTEYNGYIIVVPQR